jgi:pimeloyl-ACP methyl ester carboxylesterase
LIPALEAKYPLVAKPEARLLRGHSSGGWSTLWLALTYPETFGATWSTSPDPVDFHKMQLADIYRGDGFYAQRMLGSTAAANTEGSLTSVFIDYPSYRAEGVPKMTIREENGMEEVLGPDNTSGQQWDSWFAVWGPRSEHGNPAALIDPRTGGINRSIAEQYRKYDVTDLLRTRPDRYAPLLKDRCRVQVGDKDSFYLNEAVALLKEELDKHAPASGPGYIKILAGYDHGSIAMSPAFRDITKEMIEHLSAIHLVSPP